MRKLLLNMNNNKKKRIFVIIGSTVLKSNDLVRHYDRTTVEIYELCRKCEHSPNRNIV